MLKIESQTFHLSVPTEYERQFFHWAFDNNTLVRRFRLSLTPACATYIVQADPADVTALLLTCSDIYSIKVDKPNP